MLFTDLPQDMRQYVLSFFSIRELAKISLVSLRLNADVEAVMKRKSKEELNEILTNLTTFFNNRLASLKEELKQAEVEKKVFVDDVASYSAMIVVIGKGAAILGAVMDAYALYHATFEAGTLKNYGIAVAIGLVETACILGTKKANSVLEAYDKKKVEAFTKVENSEFAFMKERLNANKRLLLCRQKITQKNSFFAVKPRRNVDANINTNINTDLESQIEKATCKP